MDTNTDIVIRIDHDSEITWQSMDREECATSIIIKAPNQRIIILLPNKQQAVNMYDTVSNLMKFLFHEGKENNTTDS